MPDADHLAARIVLNQLTGIQYLLLSNYSIQLLIIQCYVVTAVCFVKGSAMITVT